MAFFWTQNYLYIYQYSCLAFFVQIHNCFFCYVYGFVCFHDMWTEHTFFGGDKHLYWFGILNIETLFHRLVVAEPLQNYPIFGHKFHFGFFWDRSEPQKFKKMKPDQIWSSSRFWSDLIRFHFFDFLDQILIQMQVNLKLNVKKMDSDVSAMASLWKRAFCAQISKCFMFIFIGCKICCCNCIHIYIYFF